MKRKVAQRNFVPDPPGHGSHVPDEPFAVQVPVAKMALGFILAGRDMGGLTCPPFARSTLRGNPMPFS